MSRNRVIYQSEALYTSSGINSTGSGQHAQLERVQSANYNFSISRQDVNQYGQLSRIDSLVLDPPTVNLDFSYYLTDGFNERALGFAVKTGTSTDVNFASGHMTTTSGRNLYITTTPEGADAITNTGVESVIGLGNAFLTDYSLELAVGSLPTVSVSMECANINSSVTAANGVGASGTVITGIPLPSIDPSLGTANAGTASLPVARTGVSAITALRPGDVTVNIGSFDGLTISDISGTSETIHIQSASLSIPLSRTPLQRLGTKFPFARTVDFPVTASLSVNAIVNSVTAANLANILNDNTSKEVVLTIKDTNNTARMIYTLKGCRIDSESFSSSIGSNKSVDLTFSTQVGGANDTNNGVFVSGANNTSVFL
jgi:hypothetical protein